MKRDNTESLRFGDVFSATITGAALAAAIIFVGIAEIRGMDARRAHSRQRQVPNDQPQPEKGFPGDWLRYTMPENGFQKLVLLKLAGYMGEFYPDAHIGITPEQVIELLNTPIATLENLIDD